ncbi:Vab2p LALA0_S01e09736g [Lachancea lanzarotensis]|uniref:LALA0S01e09736g1_1 n=1 Tax=Lachancea lanzarotensis TaxID=1245769 RepID=A0A0C7MKR3_9SACH|nr:uncharacterized protein LALA0_S01e09736g [Lachancea lanzarotensis]CEP60393.1 LALA0S01e09736g1_1 [Lachancea lanzarotensis]
MNNGARIHGKVGPVDKRRTHEFRTIKSSEFFHAIKQLPELTPSKQLTHEATFREVQAEFNQVRADIVRIDTLVEKDISLERAQTSQIELQLKSSVGRLNHHYKKVERIRERRERTAEAEQRECIGMISELENTQVLLQEQVELVLHKVAKKESELPVKHRLLNELSFNKRHYPLLHELLESRFASVTSSENPESQKADSTVRPKSEDDNNNGRTHADSISANSPPKESEQLGFAFGESRQSSTLRNALKSEIPPPSLISGLFRSKSSAASASTTFHQATRSNPITSNTSESDTSEIV